MEYLKAHMPITQRGLSHMIQACFMKCKEGIIATVHKHEESRRRLLKKITKNATE